MIKSTDKLHKILDLGKEAIYIARSGQSHHSAKFRKELAMGTFAATVAVSLGVLAFICLHKAKESKEAHAEWEKLDQNLDDALAEPLDASDAVAKY